MDPNFLQGNKDHQMRLLRLDTFANFCRVEEVPDQREPTMGWLEEAQIG